MAGKTFVCSRCPMSSGSEAKTSAHILSGICPQRAQYYLRREVEAPADEVAYDDGNGALVGAWS